MILNPYQCEQNCERHCPTDTMKTAALHSLLVNPVDENVALHKEMHILFLIKNPDSMQK